jgi:LPS sulfotransferase NodH
VFGTKLHWSQFEALCDEFAGHPTAGQVPSRAVVDELLPGSRFVRITRLDLEAQAVSFWVALNSKEWSRRTAGARPSLPPTPYSFLGIERCRAEIADGVVGWHHFFAFNGITPLDIVYEELAASHGAEVRRTLEHILPGVAIPEIPPPGIVRQSDEHSAALIARYRRERARHRRQVAHGGRLLLGASALRHAVRDLR